ncbi:MAG: NADH:flavin oxidoreductase [Myxococcota bacterium]|nr:NADH:flavin oxidoreductase [Myxococcota bacterium]
MKDEMGFPTRREFLKAAAAASGAALILGIGCTSEDEQDSDVEGGDIQPFSPGTIGTLQLKNRLVRSATGECLALNGEFTDKYLETMTALATGGVGMIISGMTAPVQTDAVPLQLYAYDDQYINSLKKVKEAVSGAASDCKLVAQISHSGNLYVGETRTGPSNISWPGDVKPMRALSVEEIGAIVEDFAQAVRRFKEAGWDGVELHAAHGYLLSSFLSNYTNDRTDLYGGSVQNRVRILREIVERARVLVGSDFPILVKVNSTDSGDYVGEGFVGGIGQEVFLETAAEIAQMDIDALDVSGNSWMETASSDPESQSFFLKAAEALEIDVPVILTGGNRTVPRIEEILTNKKVDFIGLARPLIREPDLPNKWSAGETTGAKCISCNQCFYNIFAGLRCHQEP